MRPPCGASGRGQLACPEVLTGELRTLGHDPATIISSIGPLEIRAEQALGATYIVLVGIVNYFGIHRGAVLQNLSTVLKVAALALLVPLRGVQLSQLEPESVEPFAVQLKFPAPPLRTL